MSESAKSFEALLTELEDRVRRLEGGEPPLEEALRLFEEGIALTRQCHERLGDAERRVLELSAAPDGTVREKEL